MALFLGVSVMISGVYALIILLFRAGLTKIKKTGITTTKTKPAVTIIVPVRNEAHNIIAIADCLLHQDYPKEKVEIIFSDDYSGDNTRDLIQDLCVKHQQLTLVCADDGNTGKKSALRRGIYKARGELILTTDADCRMGPGWIDGMVACFCQQNAVFVIGPVAIQPLGKNLFSMFQSIEFLSLSAVTAGSAGLGHPVMCNGANLAFSKETWLKVKDHLPGENYSSGDDMFLLQAVKKQKGIIEFARDGEAIVNTLPVKNIMAFLYQRARWAGKFGGYKDFSTSMVAIIAGLMNLTLLLTFFSMLLFPGMHKPFLFSFLIKLPSDFLLLKKANTFFRLPGVLWFFPLATLVYPIYVGLTLAMSILASNNWKGRKT